MQINIYKTIIQYFRLNELMHHSNIIKTPCSTMTTAIELVLKIPQIYLKDYMFFEKLYGEYWLALDYQ